MTERARVLPLALVLLAATTSVLAHDSDSGSTDVPTADESCRYLDAAIRWYGMLYFFSGDEYMALDYNRNESYVADISDWDGLPADIDAAFQWSGDHSYYFTKGEDYYQYSIVSLYGPWNATCDWHIYFKDGIDAAADRNGETYFFKGSTYTVWYSSYCGISHIIPIPSPLPQNIDAAFESDEDAGTMVVIKGDTMWEWGPDYGEIFGPFPVSDYYTMRSWTLCPLTS